LVFNYNLRSQTLHEQLMVSFRCHTDSSNREGFATVYASAIFDYVPSPSAAINYEFGGLWDFYWQRWLIPTTTVATIAHGHTTLVPDFISTRVLHLFLHLFRVVRYWYIRFSNGEGFAMASPINLYYMYSSDYFPDPSTAIINTATSYTGCYDCYRSYSIRSFVVDVFDREGFTIASAPFWSWYRQFIWCCYYCFHFQNY